MFSFFDEYVSNYGLNDINIKLKYNHSYRVMELSKKYATELGFSNHDIELATVIGLLHDIGRFEQLKVYHTYDDSKNVDHASYGVNELFNKGYIKKFWDNEDDYEIIRFAIENHNKFKIEATGNERALMHAKLIRDTDKIDILYLLGYLKELNQKADDSNISEDMIKSIYNHESVLLNKDRTNNDHIVTKFGYVFDINYDICLEEFKRNLDYYYNEIEPTEKIKKLYEEIINYLDERIDKYVRQQI